MNKPNFSSLLLFLLPAMLALGLMAASSIFSTSKFLNTEKQNIDKIENYSQQTLSTLNFIQKAGNLHTSLEKALDGAKNKTLSQPELYIAHTKIVDELALLETELIALKTELNTLNISDSELSLWISGFTKFKNFALMATDIIAIDATTATSYVNQAQKSFFDFSHQAYDISEKMSYQTQDTLTDSKVLLNESENILYLMLFMASFVALIVAFFVALKLSNQHREILASMHTLTQSQNDIPELPRIEQLAAQTQGEIKHLANSVLKFREALVLSIEEQQQIYDLAFFDRLTKLPNRSALVKSLKQDLTDGQMNRQPGALLKLNLNRFTLFNDGLGYNFGDELLKAVALRLEKLPIKDSECFRSGGDEFSIKIPPSAFEGNAPEQELNAIANKIQEHLDDYFWVMGQQIKISVSIGSTFFPLNADDTPLEVLRHAMIALNYAKQKGQNETAQFTETMLKIASNRFELEKELEQAIKNNEIAVYLQTQVHPSSEIHYAEALVRWIHPTKGMISPGEFIPVAEKSDLIVKLDRYVFEKTCELIVQETLKGNSIHISVNISGRHFIKPGFVDYVEEYIQSIGMDAYKLTLEMTESILISDIEIVTHKMHRLRKLGIGLSIDDFGTGYSSLAYLKNLPVNELKVDKAFIQNIANNTDDFKLVRAIFEVAKTFGLKIVVEGVEDTKQIEVIKSLGSPIIQGFIYARPIPAKDWCDQLA